VSTPRALRCELAGYLYRAARAAFGEEFALVREAVLPEHRTWIEREASTALAAVVDGKFLGEAWCHVWIGIRRWEREHAVAVAPTIPAPSTMTRFGILARLREELDSFSDDDLVALEAFGYGAPQIWFERPQSVANANVALHNVDPVRARAQWERLQKIRG